MDDSLPRVFISSAQYNHSILKLSDFKWLDLYFTFNLFCISSGQRVAFFSLSNEGPRKNWKIHLAQKCEKKVIRISRLSKKASKYEFLILIILIKQSVLWTLTDLCGHGPYLGRMLQERNYFGSDHRRYFRHCILREIVQKYTPNKAQREFSLMHGAHPNLVFFIILQPSPYFLMAFSKSLGKKNWEKGYSPFCKWS